MRFGNAESSSAWDRLCNAIPGPLRTACDAITRDPRDRSQPRRHHQLRDDLATRMIQGRVMEQWQYEVTGPGRVWYCVDDRQHVVWLTRATIGHPSETDA